MTSIPLKPQYGPTLGKTAGAALALGGSTVRALVIAAAVGLLALMIALVLSLLNSSYSQGGAVPFSFEYRRPLQDSAKPGRLREGRARLRRQSSRLHMLWRQSRSPRIAVASPASCRWPPLPTRAGWPPASPLSGWKGRARLASARRWPAIRCSTPQTPRRKRLYGRDVILIPPHHGASEGVVVEMLSSEPASVSKPVASSGVLETPLKTFTFG